MATGCAKAAPSGAQSQRAQLGVPAPADPFLTSTEHDTDAKPTVDAHARRPLGKVANEPEESDEQLLPSLPRYLKEMAPPLTLTSVALLSPVGARLPALKFQLAIVARAPAAGVGGAVVDGAAAGVGVGDGAAQSRTVALPTAPLPSGAPPPKRAKLAKAAPSEAFTKDDPPPPPPPQPGDGQIDEGKEPPPPPPELQT